MGVDWRVLWRKAGVCETTPAPGSFLRVYETVEYGHSRLMQEEAFLIYGSDAAYALEALNHYERNDGGKVTVRAVALADRDETGLVKRFRFYTDVTLVFAPADKGASEKA